jgi:translation initiation factor IF-1
MAVKEEKIEVAGEVVEGLPSSDRVKIELSAYDLSRRRITYRYR